MIEYLETTLTVEYMMDNWWYITGNQRQGPVTLLSIKQMLKRRVLGAETFVWHQGLSNWTKLAAVKELEPLLTSSAPPPLPKGQKAVAKPARRLPLRSLICTALCVLALVVGVNAFINQQPVRALYASVTETDKPASPVLLVNRWQNPITAKGVDIDNSWTIKRIDTDTGAASSFIGKDAIVNLTVLPTADSSLDSLVEYIKANEPSLRFISSGIFSRTGPVPYWTGIAVSPDNHNKKFVVHIVSANTGYGILIASIGAQTGQSVSRLEALMTALDDTFRG